MTKRMKLVPPGSEYLGTEYEVCGIKCSSWYCSGCCVGKGLRLRESLVPILSTFKGLMMITLTVDPKLFDSPDQADRYVVKHACIAELVRSLGNGGWLHSRRYFWVREWQEHTEMAHYHLLVDSSFVPFDTLKDRWGLFRPDGAPPVEGNAPAFGHVRISKPRFASPEHAANYACKYLCKVPDHGYPNWVRESRRRIVRYATSKHFWAGGDTASDKCDVCSQVVVNEEGESNDADEVNACDDCQDEIHGKAASTIRERVANCCTRCAVVARAEYVADDGEVFAQRYFVNMLGCTLQQALLLLGDEPCSGLRGFALMTGEYRKLVNILAAGTAAEPPQRPKFPAAKRPQGEPWRPRVPVGEGRVLVLSRGPSS